MPRTSRRPGPLKDLPLSSFLPFDSRQHTATPFKNTSKRSRSPGTPLLLSPAKKRILREDGFLIPGELSKSPKKYHLRTSPQPIAIVSGRRLTFEAHSDDSRGTDSLPQTTKIPDAGPSRILTPPPELPPSHYTTSPLPHTNQICRTPLMVPREMPPSPDRQSVHYPGFDVFRDTHIEIASTYSLPPDRESSDEEFCKENIPPRKVAKKFSSLLTEIMVEKGISLTSSGSKETLDNELVTPKGYGPGWKKGSILVPNASPSKSLSLSARRLPPSTKKSIVQARLLLEREVDEPECILSDEEDA